MRAKKEAPQRTFRGRVARAGSRVPPRLRSALAAEDLTGRGTYFSTKYRKTKSKFESKVESKIK